jgi:hypothetical protein
MCCGRPFQGHPHGFVTLSEPLLWGGESLPSFVFLLDWEGSLCFVSLLVDLSVKVCEVLCPGVGVGVGGFGGALFRG